PWQQRVARARERHRDVQQRATSAKRHEPCRHVRSGRWRWRRKRDAQLSQTIVWSGQPREYTGLSRAGAQVGDDGGQDHSEGAETQTDVGQLRRSEYLAQKVGVARTRRARPARGG